MPVTMTALAHAKEQVSKARMEFQQAQKGLNASEKILSRLLKELHQEAMADPQPGDRYTEMYNFWLYVVARDGNDLTVMHASPPCQFPEDAATETLTVVEFQKRFTFMDLVDRENSVEGWLDTKK
jgi:hypothetical protein